MVLISKIKPKDIEEYIDDECWIEDISKKSYINQYEKNQVWTMVPPPKGYSIISE